THALPGRARARRAGVDASRRQVLLLDVDLVRSGDAGSVAEPLDRTTAQDVRGEDLVQIGFLDPRVPEVVRIDDDHGAVATLREAAGLVDANVHLLPGLLHARPQDLHVFLGVPLSRARLPARTHEHVALVLAHDFSFCSAELVVADVGGWEPAPPHHEAPTGIHPWRRARRLAA